MMKRIRRRRGFSLIELLVVLVILALLAGIVLPRFLDQQKKGQRQAAVTQIGAFKSSLQLYMLDNKGQAPGDLSDLVNGDKNYLTDVKSIPPDPWGNPYLYEAPGPNGEDFVVRSLGADGKEGGDKDNADISSADAGSNQ